MLIQLRKHSLSLEEKNRIADCIHSGNGSEEVLALVKRAIVHSLSVESDKEGNLPVTVIRQRGNAGKLPLPE